MSRRAASTALTTLDDQLFNEWQRLDNERTRLAQEATAMVMRNGSGADAKRLMDRFATYLRELGALELLIERDTSQL